MNWGLLINVVLSLSAPAQVGIGIQTTTAETVSANFVSVDVIDDTEGTKSSVPFVIDQGEVQGATAISAGLFEDEVSLQGKSSGNFSLSTPISQSNPIIIVDLSGPTRGLVASDVLIWSQKETLSFNAENTARAAVVRGLLQLGIVESQLAGAYTDISAHPRFIELKQLMEIEKGYPESEERLDRIAEIVSAISIEVLKASNLPSGLLQPQKVLSPYRL